MVIIFEKDYLKQLYENGKAKNKKYRFQKIVITKYIQTIDKLRVAKRVEDLYLLKSLNYEKLRGNKKGLESVRVDKKYRIEFKSNIERDKPEIITICSIIDLSNHYK
ncbi:MAG: plasmid maintenance system killer protein [Chlorobi bacterium]|nr:plasmid maintenance system killer protein [Chlorobiota bacterium]